MKTNKGQGQATLQRVAEHAGVSKATASMILSGRSSYRGLFNPETVRRVCRSAAALKYRTNVFASSLGKHKTPFFALVIPGSGHETWRAWRYDVFESLLLGGVLAVSAETSTYPIVLTLAADATAARLQAVDDIIAGGVFGTIARTPPAPLAERLIDQIRHGQPAVIVFPESGFPLSSNVVDTDNLAMGQMAGEIFTRHGLKKWAVVCFKGGTKSQEIRREGLEKAAKYHGAKAQVIRLPFSTNSDEISEVLMPRLLRARPDAIFGVNAAASVGSILASTRMGRDLGEDINIIGVDSALWGEESPAHISITSLSVSWKEAGGVAMQKLLDMRSAGESVFPTTLLRPVIRVGKSCRVPEDLVNANRGILSA